MIKDKIVLGSLFGDEGKGTTVQWLCKRAIEDRKSCVVVRFCGGPQAGHTVTNNGITHEFSSFGSGSLLGVPTYITEDVLIDPICFCKEYDVLLEKGIVPKFCFSRNCRIITPYDVKYAVNDEETLNNGTTGHGVYATVERCKTFRTDFTLSPTMVLMMARDHYNFDRDEELDELFLECWKRMNILNTKLNLDSFKERIWEGTQGLLLDADCGFYPNVTATNVGLNAVPEEYLKNSEVYLVSRTYLTRHGNGYNPAGYTALDDIEESNKTNQYQGVFKKGVYEFKMLNTAYQRHCIDNYCLKNDIKLNLVITHVDFPHTSYIYVDNQGNIKQDKSINILQIFKDNIDFNVKDIYYSDNNLSNIKKW